MTRLLEPFPANDTSAIRLRARRNARDAIGLFSQNSNWGPNNLARLSRQRRLHRCQVFRVSRTTGTSSHEVDEMLTALTYWQESQRARENVCVYTDILSLATKSVVVLGWSKGCMLLESVNMVTAIHHTFAMLSYFLLTSKVLKDLNRVIISERQLRKYGAPQQSLQQVDNRVVYMYGTA